MRCCSARSARSVSRTSSIIYTAPFPTNLIYAGFAAFMTLLAISSSSMLALVIQAGMMVYERALRPFRAKWIVLRRERPGGALRFEAIFSMSIADYLVTELALNQAGAETRLDQIDVRAEGGLAAIRSSGSAWTPPALPFWRSDIFDNFWLHTAVRFGMPASGSSPAAFALHFLVIAFRRSEGRDYDMLRRGYVIALAATMVLIGSIPLWSSALVFVMVYLGAGAWFYDQRAAPGPRRAPRERPRAARPAVPARPGRAGVPDPSAGRALPTRGRKLTH